LDLYNSLVAEVIWPLIVGVALVGLVAFGDAVEFGAVLCELVGIVVLSVALEVGVEVFAETFVIGGVSVSGTVVQVDVRVGAVGDTTGGLLFLRLLGLLLRRAWGLLFLRCGLLFLLPFGVVVVVGGVGGNASLIIHGLEGGVEEVGVVLLIQ